MKDLKGLTPLHDAAEKGHEEICKIIIDSVENKNPNDALGNTPLHLAAKKGHRHICKLIMDVVINKNPKNKDGCTPLHNAIEEGNMSICKLITDRIEDSSFIAKVVRKYRATEMREISLDLGQIITNVHELNTELWYGVAPDGNYGCFPANCAEVYGRPTKKRKM